MKNDFYFNPAFIRSHNKLFNFIIGNRRSGKTYGSLCDCIKRFIQGKGASVYLRRYKTELSTKLFKRLFNEIININHEFKNHKLETEGLTLYVDGKPCIYGMPLSTGKIQKGINLADVTTIIFDEFLIETGVYNYLPDEVSIFLDLYLTVSSYRPVSVFFLANAVSVTNPYFLYFDLKLPENSKIWKRKNSELLVYLLNNENFISHVTKTRVGKFLTNYASDYANYAVLNEFYLDNDIFVEPRPKKSRHLFNFLYEGQYLGVWEYLDYWYVSHKHNKNAVINIATTKNDHKKNTFLLTHRGRDSYLGRFIMMYNLGKLRFDDINLKNISYNIIKNCYKR